MGAQPPSDFADLSIEELMNETVTSVAKKETRLFASPAAIAVVINDDVRRLGIDSFPEALRWLPGTNVARINSTQWAVSVRGFNSQLSDKLLVLQDGRTLYTPTFGGVFWDSQDAVMEDLERIEVIRGPGATLWGSNAVNGVVNIVTKGAKDTQGTMISASMGTDDRPAVSVRHGGGLGKSGHYRAYLKHFHRDNWGLGGQAPTDHWQATRGGFRYDAAFASEQSLTVQGEYYLQEHSEVYQTVVFERPFVRTVSSKNEGDGYHLLSRWSRRFSKTAEVTVQGFFDAYQHSNNGTEETRRTFDLELQHRFGAGTRHDIVWGAGYRLSRDRLVSTPFLEWNPEEREIALVNLFMQDEITLRPDRLNLVLGAKFEHNPYIEWETQPAARLLWTPSRRQTFWAGVSRAVRTPTRLDTEARVNGMIYDNGPLLPPTVISFLGNSDPRSEEVTAFEAGWRIEPSPGLSIDLAIFHNTYRHLAVYEDRTPVFVADPSFPHVVVPAVTTSNGRGESRGAELAVAWQPAHRWRLVADYSLLEVRLRPDPEEEGDNPEHRFNLRSYLDLPGHWELNMAVGYTSRLQNSITHTRIPAYTRFDAGLVWRPSTAWELGLWGRNLQEPAHPEFSQIVVPGVVVEIPREISVRVRWRF
jgi:iron complex outermembrane receptor protein